MNSLLTRLRDKPHYVFHPSRALRRAMRSARPHAYVTDEFVTTDLPWGVSLRVALSDAIGYSIVTGHVFDPCVTETIYRLIDPGDHVIDVGANIGYLTSLAAVRAGDSGTVIAYEPHPSVYELLRDNVARWEATPGLAQVQTRRAALSDEAGSGVLAAGPLFAANMGLAALRMDGETEREEASVYEVAIERLDEIVGDGAVGLLKIDVEGHEPQVLRGAAALLARGGVRDVIFEDHDDYPSAATAVVEAAGYALLSLENDLFGLRLGGPADRRVSARWPGPSYLATRDPERARARLSRRGWQVGGIGPTLPGYRARRRIRG